jgi:predicted RecB family nuclease
MTQTWFHPPRKMRITACLFEAGIKCLTKCFLRSIGVQGAGNAYADWVKTKSDSYHRAGIKRLIAGAVHDKCISGLATTENLKTAQWRLAMDIEAHVRNLESNIHAVERIQFQKSRQASKIIPIRFIFTNKLTSDDKMLLSFDALVLSEMLGREISLGRIIHGDAHTTLKVKITVLARKVRKLIGQIDKILSLNAPPELVLNRHCAECEFQIQCRGKTIAKDDLSLLSGMSEKERKKLNGKGIFTVTQLSYTFRPRRMSKRLAAKPEKYHHSLKALAIREQKIHIVGNPQLRIGGTPIFLDVEGLPDRDSYYLIGVRFKTSEGIIQHSLWADRGEEEKIWIKFLRVLSDIENPVLIHYGSFETTFLKKMCNRYGGPPEDSAAFKAIESSVNLLSVIFAQVYFPSYSNGLKENARFLGFEWTDDLSSGLQSIVWRHQWEESPAPTIKEKLIAYNADDCEAIRLVVQTLDRIAEPDTGVDEFSGSEPKIVHVESLGKNLTSKWCVFKSPISELEHINVAAHWNYQRDRVFVRSGIFKKQTTRLSRMRKAIKRVETVVMIKAPVSCPECGNRRRRKERLLYRTVQDLVFGRDSVKRRVVQYIIQTYRCRSCRHEYGLHEWYLHVRKWGWNMVAYFVYHIVGLRVPQLTVQHNLNRLFGFDIVRSTLNNLKINASDYYWVTKNKILDRIIQGNLIHVDETRANIKGHLAYVWVLTNLREVVYILTESREGEMVQELLKVFNGVLLSDFYAAYDVIECPQQKCLIHFMRDINDEILNNPFDEELKSIVTWFAGLLKPMIDTIDIRGLKKYYLKKYLVKVDRFYGFLDKSDFKSESSLKCKQRFEKNRDKLFTFLRYDGVPWNNNNAEHAIKAFARLRDVISGLSIKKGIDEYLTLLSVAGTCEYQGLDFLDFLRSGEKDVQAFAEKKQRGRRGDHIRLPMHNSK